MEAPLDFSHSPSTIGNHMVKTEFAFENVVESDENSSPEINFE